MTYTQQSTEDLSSQYPELDREIASANFKPSEQQLEGMCSLWDFVTRDRNFQQRYFGFYGFAGTGKTTCIQIFLQALRYCPSTRLFQVAQCAPTNKAVKVLKQKGLAMGNGSHTYTTVHKLLGLAREIGEDGNISYVPKAPSANSQQKYCWNYDLVILDECSMIGDELWQQIQSSVNNNEPGDFTQLICMGDPAQLPPVGKSTAGAVSDQIEIDLGQSEYVEAASNKESPIFREIPDSLTLSQVMRYDGTLTRLAQDIRENLNREQSPAIWDYLCDQIDACDDMEWLEQLIASFKQQKEEVLSPDFCKAICYTNRAVDAINHQVRVAVLGEIAKTTQFLPGDRLVLTAPLQKMGTTVLSTRSEVFLSKSDLYEPPADLSPDAEPALHFKHWRLVGFDEERIPRSLQVLNPTEEKAFEVKGRKLKKLAQVQKDSAKRKQAWKDYYAHVERFATVQYAFAMTTHSAQGSTFEHCFVNYADLLKNTRTRERNQLIYTAITRASKRVVLAV